METRYKGYTLTVGLEIHAELKTVTKMFCASRNDPHGSAPNTNVCPVCMGHPGTLPVINKEAVRHVLSVGAAVGGELATFTEFDRKNYFYPDIPKGYQISQYQYPLVRGGALAGVALTRIHLEEDTARSQHDQGEGSLIDYNRAGVPLMELVTEPVIHDSKTAGLFARELQLLLRTLGVSGAQMERGEMRVEANISVSKSDTFGTKVEVKNLNSFKSVESAIEYELKRQVELIERGEQVIQETRGWDESRAKTFSQRKKESAHDYRYFPEPDLPKLDTMRSEPLLVSRIIENLPDLPEMKREKYNNLGLTREQIEVLIGSRELDEFFAAIARESADERTVKAAANYITTDLLPHMSHDRPLALDARTRFVVLIEMTLSGTITSRVAKDMLPLVVFDGVDPVEYAQTQGLMQTNAEDALVEIARTVISANPSVVDEYRSGKTSAVQFLVGQGMKISKGTANPLKLRELFEAELS